MGTPIQENKKNPFIFLFLMATISAVMYCIAFHKERDMNKTLQGTIDSLIRQNTFLLDK